MKCREDRRDVVVTTSAGNRDDGDARRQRRQEVSYSSLGDNSQTPGLEHVSNPALAGACICHQWTD